jgi:hypothetical protein
MKDLSAFPLAINGVNLITQSPQIRGKMLQYSQSAQLDKRVKHPWDSRFPNLPSPLSNGLVNDYLCLSLKSN